MSYVITIAVVLQIMSAIAVIILVLLQHGKGADLGAAFGGGASGSLFGATGSANFLSRSTAVASTIFFCSTLAITIGARYNRGPVTGGVLGTIEESGPAVPGTIEGSLPAGAVEGTIEGSEPAQSPASANSQSPASIPTEPAPATETPSEPEPTSNQIPK